MCFQLSRSLRADSTLVTSDGVFSFSLLLLFLDCIVLTIKYNADNYRDAIERKEMKII